jgi:hypothetical protein
MSLLLFPPMLLPQLLLDSLASDLAMQRGHVQDVFHPLGNRYQDAHALQQCLCSSLRKPACGSLLAGGRSMVTRSTAVSADRVNHSGW